MGSATNKFAKIHVAILDQVYAAALRSAVYIFGADELRRAAAEEERIVKERISAGVTPVTPYIRIATVPECPGCYGDLRADRNSGLWVCDNQACTERFVGWPINGELSDRRWRNANGRDVNPETLEVIS